MRARLHRSIVALLTLAVAAASPAHAQTDIYDSGGPLMPEQAAYDVEFYDLALRVDPRLGTPR